MGKSGVVRGDARERDVGMVMEVGVGVGFGKEGCRRCTTNAIRQSEVLNHPG